MLTQVYVGVVFFCLVFGVVFCLFLGGSKTVLEPKMAPREGQEDPKEGIFPDLV